MKDKHSLHSTVGAPKAAITGNPPRRTTGKGSPANEPRINQKLLVVCILPAVFLSRAAMFAFKNMIFAPYRPVPVAPAKNDFLETVERFENSGRC